jgi:8-oxo-dGTP diphosphatase
MARGAVVIVDDEKVALIERVRGGRTYYLFPGGGTEEGETPEDAARREACEELGVSVQLGRLLAIVVFQGDEQFFYSARVLAGEFGTGRGSELTASPDSITGSYTPVWLQLSELPVRDVRPRALAQAVVSGAVSGWLAMRLLDG